MQFVVVKIALESLVGDRAAWACASRTREGEDGEAHGVVGERMGEDYAAVDCCSFEVEVSLCNAARAFSVVVIVVGLRKVRGARREGSHQGSAKRISEIVTALGMHEIWYVAGITEPTSITDSNRLLPVLILESLCAHVSVVVRFGVCIRSFLSLELVYISVITVPPFRLLLSTSRVGRGGPLPSPLSCRQIIIIRKTRRTRVLLPVLGQGT